MEPSTAPVSRAEPPPVPAPWPGVIYFAVVFGAGFVLGPIRVLWLVPQVGVRTAELVEAPVMLAVIVVAAQWVVRRCRVPPRPRPRLGMGLLALLLLAIAELSFADAMLGLSPWAYVTSRDPVAGPVHAASVLFFALAPCAVVRKRDARTEPARVL